MQRTVVTRIHGNPELGKAIAAGFESPELKRLREKIEDMDHLNAEKARKRIKSIPRRFPIRKHSLIYHKIWGIVGLLWLLAHDQI